MVLCLGVTKRVAVRAPVVGRAQHWSTEKLLMAWCADASEENFPSEGVIHACLWPIPFFLDFLFSEVVEFEAKKFSYLSNWLKHRKALEQECTKAKFEYFVSDIAAAWLAGFHETRPGFF